MSAEDNKAIIRDIVDVVWNGHDMTRVADFHADEFTVNGEQYTPAKFATENGGMFAFFADFREEIDAIVAENDSVAYRWTMGGTDPRTGDWRSWRGMSMSRFAGGKIVEEWYVTEQTAADWDAIVAWLGSRPGGAGGTDRS